VKYPDKVSVDRIDEFAEIIDVRSPAEFIDDHVPGAISAPVLDNEQRAQIGTLHKQMSPFDAKKAGAALVSRNIATHLETLFAGRGRDWRPLVYCWRGGKRSGALTHVLREIGWHAAQLDGGYKAYRSAVLAQLAELPQRLSYRVVCGETGSAKSRLLEALAARGAQVLDLEQIACHKGSLLGGLPGTPQPAQRMFESQLWQKLRHFDPGQPVFVEAESKKIGQLQVPDALITAMRASSCVHIETELAQRVQFLIGDYAHFLTDAVLLKDRLGCLVELHGREVIARWDDCIDRQDWTALVTDLLQNHYDPAYRKSMPKNYRRYAEALVIKPRDLTPEGIGRAAGELLGNTAI
jgi:tRNA 2-selenouridine synthase